jgi:hypothetical protein
MGREFWRMPLRKGPEEISGLVPLPFSEITERNYAENLHLMLGLEANFKRSLDAYTSELGEIANIRRRDGRPIFSGVGLYPEMGADFMPLVQTSTQGHLLGLSMHEGELLSAHALASELGFNLNSLVGKYLGSERIPRDVPVGEVAGEGSEVNPDKLWRTRKNRLGIGLKIGSLDWRHFGRMHKWENMTFLPSVSGDFSILDHALSGGKLDWVIIKGTHGWRYRYEGRDLAEYTPHGRWAERLCDIMAPGSHALVSFMDRPLVRVFEKNGFEIVYETPAEKYPAESPIAHFSLRSPRDSLGVRLYRGVSDMEFLPRGEFTVLERA